MFREYIRDLAVKYRLLGEVHNINNYYQDVMVICEGGDQRIKDFIRKLEALKEEKRPKKEKISPITEREKMLIHIDKVEVSFYSYKGIFDTFTIIRSADEAGERFAEGGQQIAALREENRANFRALDEKYGEFTDMLEKMPKEIAKELKRIL